MTANDHSFPSIDKIFTWLNGLHGGEVKDLAPLSGGFWSSAFAYRAADQNLVLRLSDMAEGFEIDTAAWRFNGPDLPVPKVIETGEVFGLNYAISERHFGRFIETTSRDEGTAVGRTLETLLAALRAVETSAGDPVLWYDPQESRGVTWHSWLANGLVDNPETEVSGWRAMLADRPDIDTLFKACESRIQELLPACPERRDLIHGDLLHQNVLVSNDVSRVTAVFSWKCSVFGDYLYDVAWCTFWSGWHPGIAAADILRRTMRAPDLTETDLVNASLRHHCYELHIGATHLGWNAWTGNQQELEVLAGVLERTLTYGPLPAEQLI